VGEFLMNLVPNGRGDVSASFLLDPIDTRTKQRKMPTSRESAVPAANDTKLGFVRAWQARKTSKPAGRAALSVLEYFQQISKLA
jgi:hypothetical protein